MHKEKRYTFNGKAYNAFPAKEIVDYAIPGGGSSRHLINFINNRQLKKTTKCVELANQVAETEVIVYVDSKGKTSTSYGDMRFYLKQQANIAVVGDDFERARMLIEDLIDLERIGE